MFYAYVLRSLKDGSHYYGSTKDIGLRLKERNSGAATYTMRPKPFVLAYSESFESRKEAFARERFFKSVSGYNWLRKNKIID